jgi:hypothetical protein
VVVVFEKNFAHEEEVEGRPQIFLYLDHGVFELHEHEVAQSVLIRSPHEQVDLSRDE